jgi:1-acyl-sn-glycerol-3-phosphate acyltransferase
MMRRLLDAFVERLVRLIVHVFFRQIEVRGREQIPVGVPLLVVVNHVNSLVDPLLVIGCLGVRPRFLAKSTLWRNPLMRPLLALGGVVPVYRRQDQDQGVDTSRNMETFSRCHELLATGGTIAIFPEGLSHSEPSLQPLKTGAARIAREAEVRLGPLGARIVPVGLVFDAKGIFRSRVLVQVGEPIDPLQEPAPDPEDERAACRRLTDRINQGLAAVTLNYESWEQARLIERAADLYGRPLSELPTDKPLADQFSLRQAFITGMGKLTESHPDQVGAVATAVRRYDRLLALTGLRDDQIGSVYPKLMVSAFAWRSAVRLLLLLPLALIGTLLNWLPYRVCGAIADRFEHLPDVQATYKVFPAIFLYPLTWTIEIVAAWLIGGTPAAAVIAVLAPTTGWIAAVFNQRRQRLALETRAYLLLRSHRKLVLDLKQRRQELWDRISELVDLYEEVAD